MWFGRRRSLDVERSLDDHAGGDVVRGEWPMDKGSGDPRGRRRRPCCSFDDDQIDRGRHREVEAAGPPPTRAAPVVTLSVQMCSAIGLAAPVPPRAAAALHCSVKPTGSAVDLLRFLQHATHIILLELFSNLHLETFFFILTKSGLYHF